MRAKPVNEVQEFERGQDPKKSLRIGHDQVFLEDVKEEVEELVDEMGMSVVDDLSDEDILELRDEKYAAWQVALVIMGESERDVFENQNFERGQEPKEAMGIGLKKPSYDEVLDIVFDGYDDFELYVNDYFLDKVFRKYPKADPKDIESAVKKMTEEIIDIWIQTIGNEE